MKTEFDEYSDCKAAAQKMADATGADYGIERNTLFGHYRFFRLPWPQHRQGHEMRCEAVMCSDWDKRQRDYLGG